MQGRTEGIVNQGFNAFQTNFTNMVNFCNGCHVATGFRYIVYQLPNQPTVLVKLDTGDTFTKQRHGCSTSH